MISFGLTEEQELAREAMRDFAKGAMRPLARECDETATIPEDFLQQAWELGLTSTEIPAELGGGGEESSPLLNVLMLEELVAHGDAALAMAALCPSLFVRPLIEQGTEQQKKGYLPPFTGEGFQVGTLALTEDRPVFDVSALATTARPEKDTVVLDGRKRFVPLAERASWILVVAREESNADRRTSAEPTIQAYVVPRDAPGLSVSQPEEKLGLHALSTHVVTLEGVEVPRAARLGGEAPLDFPRLLDATRIAMSALMVGLSRAVMDYCIPYAKDRVAFGEAIAQKQAIAFKLSSMRVETDSTRLLVWKGGSALERGEEATRAAHLAHQHAVEHSMKIADDGVQVLGGHGFMRDHPVEMWYRNARTLGVLEGCAIV